MSRIIPLRKLPPQQTGDTDEHDTTDDQWKF
jgi:hypothetical protein